MNQGITIASQPLHLMKRGKRHLLLGAVIVGIMLVVVLEVIVQLLPPHYNLISQSESDLAVGPYGFLMALDFIIGGVLLLLFIVAFRRVIPKQGQSRSGLILLGVAAMCKLIIAFAATDLTPRPGTIHGTIHANVRRRRRKQVFHSTSQPPEPKLFEGSRSATTYTERSDTNGSHLTSVERFV
jgi:hypothetical protein